MKTGLKKVLGFVLSIVLVLSLMPQTTLKSEAAGDTVKGVLTSDGTMYIIYDANSYSAGGTYEGKTITNVYDCDGGNGAMADYNESGTPAPWHGNRDNISAVVIGYGVTHIGDYAFGNGFEKYLNIVSAMLSSTVTSIGEGAFCACENLATVNIEAGSVLQSIGMIAFKRTGITSFTIPDTVTHIDYSAFYDCKSLTSITIPSGVTDLGAHAFSGCSSLEEAIIEAEITKIEICTFADCYSLRNVIISNSIRTIGVHAFEYCYSLTSITIPDSVERVLTYAFKNTGLRSVEFKGEMTMVEGDPFENVGKYTYTYEGGNWVQSDQNVTPAELIIPHHFVGGEPDENHNWCGGLFTAKFTSPVTLNTNGGTINSGNVTSYVEGNEVTLPTDVTRDGYTFGGWYDNSECTGTAITKIPTTATGPQEFWAKWDREPTPIQPTPIVITYRVNFDPNGGIYNGDNLEIEEGKPFGFSYSPGMIIRKGYLFAGWYTAPVGGERVKSDTIFDGTTTTLYAHWVKVFTGKVWSFEAVSYASGRLTVEVQRPVTSVSGYEVSFSTDGKTWYKREQNITWENAPVSTIYLSELLSGKYKVRVRAFRYDSAGEKVYGAWSGTKTVNIK